MHVLLIGLGNMGRKYLSKLEEMGKLPVLCDRDPNKAVGNYPFYCHFEEIQEPTKAVIIAVDPTEHVKLAKFFLENGASILLEKPPALSQREFMEIYHHPRLYISEVESFSSCLGYFPKDVKEIHIERLGRGKGYLSPLWDLAWHDLYLLQMYFKELHITSFKMGDVWHLEGKADGVPFSIKVAWEHPSPSRKWFINGGSLVLDFAKEEVWKNGKLIHKENRDKLRLMVEAFLSGNFDPKSKDRALKNLELLEKTTEAFALQ